VVSTDDVARRRSRFVAYGRATFALKDLERVSNCAYFVSVRSSTLLTRWAT
jgi:hypothetical protein